VSFDQYHTLKIHRLQQLKNPKFGSSTAHNKVDVNCIQPSSTSTAPESETVRGTAAQKESLEQLNFTIGMAQPLLWTRFPLPK
jgi:hypothetical protein